MISLWERLISSGSGYLQDHSPFQLIFPVTHRSHLSVRVSQITPASAHILPLIYLLSLWSTNQVRSTLWPTAQVLLLPIAVCSKIFCQWLSSTSFLNLASIFFHLSLFRTPLTLLSFPAFALKVLYPITNTPIFPSKLKSWRQLIRTNMPFPELGAKVPSLFRGWKKEKHKTGKEGQWPGNDYVSNTCLTQQNEALPLSWTKFSYTYDCPNAWNALSSSFFPQLTPNCPKNLAPRSSSAGVVL